MKLYLAGPLFSEAERAFLDLCARRLRAAGFECFVPHEHANPAEPATADNVFTLNVAALRRAEALVAWLDGPMVDDGTACEIGLFRGLMEQREPWRKGIVGLVTDLRLQRRGLYMDDGGLNLLVAGVIRSGGHVCWSLDEAVKRLDGWRGERA